MKDDVAVHISYRMEFSILPFFVQKEIFEKNGNFAPLKGGGHHIVFNIRLFCHVYWDYTFISYPNCPSEVSKQSVAHLEENCKKIEILFQFRGIPQIPKR